MQKLAEQAWSLADKGALSPAGIGQPLALRLKQLEMQCLHLVEGLDPCTADGVGLALAGELEHVHARAHDLVQRGLEACAAQQIAPAQLSLLLERVARLEQLGRTVVESAGGVSTTAARSSAPCASSPASLVAESLPAQDPATTAS
jgi:hypothetical protein